MLAGVLAVLLAIFVGSVVIAATDHTVRETADMLGVSSHTVQEHVKRLYKRSGAKNRAELADRYRDVAPQLVNLPLGEIPDHRQRIDEATRRPWPALDATAQ